MTENLVGKTLADRYHILELIGTGGMASVYKGQCELLKRDVAVKVLRDSVKDDEMALRSFKQEAQAAARLSHNNIVQVFDVGEVDGMDYIVMELVEGITLKKYIKEKGALPWHEACDMAVQIAQALEAAHSKDVVHRDIKPQNILVTEDKILKVADFGIAKAANSETMIVGDNNAMGSAHYISPEQARGGFTDARSDIYSLGIVLFEMLTGMVPFDGESAVAVALMHIEKHPPSVLSINPSIPENVAKIVSCAISKETSLRYQSATEMIADLHAVLENRPLERRDVLIDEFDDEEEFGSTRKFFVDEKDLDLYDKPRKSVRTQRLKRQQVKKDKKADLMATLLAIFTVILLVFGGFGVWSFMAKNSATVVVPDFINKSQEEAERMARERDLQIQVLKTDVSDSIPKDHISWQDPAGGIKVSKSETIFVIVSSGQSEGNISVPDLTGMSLDEAMQILLDKDLEYEIEERESLDVARDYIISQSPQKNTKVSEGYEVTLFVSIGAPVASATPRPPEKITVPSLVGKSKTEAERLCEQYSLELTTVQMDDSRPRGTVIRQEPEAGRQVDAGERVTVIISTGEGDTQISISSTQKPGNVVSEEATAKPSPEPSESASNTPTKNPEDQIKTKEFTFEIPEGEGTVAVKITVDGDTEYEKTNNWGDTVSIDVSGVDRKKVVVFLDGVGTFEEYINFN